MKRNPIMLTMAFGLCLANCNQQEPAFLIAEQQIGQLKSTDPVTDLKTIFVKDSIVRDTLKTKIRAKAKKIQIFEKGGAPLLTLTPNTDSIATIEHIQVLDPRYTTEDGISLLSTFDAIQKAYDIKKVVTTLSSVVIFPKDSNLYFIIDKAELPSNLRYTNSSIEAVQIPEAAKIKYLMIGWNE